MGRGSRINRVYVTTVLSYSIDKRFERGWQYELKYAAHYSFRTGVWWMKSPKYTLFQGILPITRSQVPSDIIAGLTLAALAIPEVLGYTRISGTPVITGLYTLLIPLALFACLGSSRHLVVGADSATAAVLAAGLVGIAATGSPEYVAYAGLLALMAGALLILARIVKLGFLADFLSRTVLVGFLSGVGFQVAVAQIPAILGLPTHAGLSGPIQELANDVQHISQTNLYTLIISIVVFLIILISKRISKKVPGALIAVIGAIIVSSAFNLPSYGVSVLGTIPSGLPVIGLPRINLSLEPYRRLASNRHFDVYNYLDPKRCNVTSVCHTLQ